MDRQADRSQHCLTNSARTTCLPVCLPACLSIHPCIHPSTHRSIYPPGVSVDVRAVERRTEGQHVLDAPLALQRCAGWVDGWVEGRGSRRYAMH
eukprot:scaffold13981_cov52-Phaeocystis_antarctica.AAC.2